MTTIAIAIAIAMKRTAIVNLLMRTRKVRVCCVIVYVIYSLPVIVHIHCQCVFLINLVCQLYAWYVSDSCNLASCSHSQWQGVSQ